MDTRFTETTSGEREIRWWRKWFGLASYVAQEWSKDPSTKVGAVVVGENQKNLAIGYNGFPPGVADTPERLNHRLTKYKLVVHAERNALDNATFETRGGTLVSTSFPCVECSKSIVSKGIKCVVTPRPPDPLEGEATWRDDLGWSENILREARVRIVFIDVISVSDR